MRTLPITATPIIAAALVIGLAACEPYHSYSYYDPAYDGYYDGHRTVAVEKKAYVDDHAVEQVGIVHHGDDYGYGTDQHPTIYQVPERPVYQVHERPDQFHGHPDGGPHYASDNHGKRPAPTAEAIFIGPAQVAEAQSTLRQLGFDPGRTDGVYGPITRRAV
ncbi:MAG: peptidoglycan-binding domain-containing protein, partial [Alphaproteobacteria bacterium]|nr:peptidoglycan-binding domain-containing protein [Alphaproteobacteria bacterium]